MKGQEKKIKLIKEIKGIPIEVGVPFLKKELKEKYPFIDFENKAYFEDSYEFKYAVGMNVKYVGSNYKVPKEKCLKIVKAYPEIFKNNVRIYYDVMDNGGCGYTVYEEDIEEIKMKWIISFSSSLSFQHPSVHEIDDISFAKRIRGTWKEPFVFNTKVEAEYFASLFDKNGDFLITLKRCKGNQSEEK